MSGITDQAKESTCKTERAEVQTAVEAYYAEYDAAGYPAQTGAGNGSTPSELTAYFRDDLKGNYTILGNW